MRSHFKAVLYFLPSDETPGPGVVQIEVVLSKKIPPGITNNVFQFKLFKMRLNFCYFTVIKLQLKVKNSNLTP